MTWWDPEKFEIIDSIEIKDRLELNFYTVATKKL